jgi:CRISPR/Cas system-associated exonuclease Cas4 (RecB family)
MNLPRDYISYNQIRLYQNCPLKYYLTYVEGISMPINDKVFMGIVFHSAAEYYFKKKIESVEPEKQEVLDVFLKNFNAFQEDTEVVWQSSAEKVKKRGLSFTKYFLNEMAAAMAPLMVEKELEVEIPGLGIRLKGIIDLVEQDFTITDFKTATSKWSKSRARGARLQMVVYKYLFEQSFGEVSSKLKFKILYSKNAVGIQHQEIRVKAEDRDEEEMLKIVRHVAENISNKVFYKNVSYLCGFCEFKDICRNYT